MATVRADILHMPAARDRGQSSLLAAPAVSAVASRRVK